jgi:tetratricopeptide (TPR) repeat protein
MRRVIFLLLFAFGLASQCAYADPESDSLDALFERLKAAPDASASETIAKSIKKIWLHSGSDTVDLLMDRADTALENQDLPLAVEILDRVITLEPDWAAGWNQRATVFFLMDDYRRSMADIAETLKREPRHYGAISGMGLIFLHRGDKKHAYDAFERVLTIYPQLETAKNAVNQLRPDVEGLPL